MVTWLCSAKVACTPMDIYSPLWNSWPGLVCVVVILLSCVFNIYSHWVDDSIADRLYYWAMLLTSVAALLQYFTPGDPRMIFQTYMILISVRFVSNIMEKLMLHFFGRNKD